MVISGKNMEKYGQSQASDNIPIILSQIPQFPWRLPEISLWKVRNLPPVLPPVKPAKKPK